MKYIISTGLNHFILMMIIFFSTPNEKLLGRLVKEKVTIILESINLALKWKPDIVESLGQCKYLHVNSISEHAEVVKPW